MENRFEEKSIVRKLKIKLEEFTSFENVKVINEQLLPKLWKFSE